MAKQGGNRMAGFWRFLRQLTELIRLILQPSSLKLIRKRFLIWRKRNIKDRQFIYLVAILIGFLSGLVAVLIKNSVYLAKELLDFIDHTLVDEFHNYLYFAYPLVGIFITVYIIKYIIRKPIVPGIPNTLHAISRRNGFFPKHNLYSSILTSALTVGFGGSVGLEGPTVGTTAAIGSTLGSGFRLTYQTRMLLIGCAATGSLASLFNAPVAAIVFAIEVIMLDLTTASLVPLLMASASAALTSRLFLGNETIIDVQVWEAFYYTDIIFFVGLGILCGLISVFFANAFFWLNRVFDQLRSDYIRLVVGGLALGLLIVVLPPLYGEGYETINALITNRANQVLNTSFFQQWSDSVPVVMLFIVALVMMKGFATFLTIRAGGVGGIFAPALFIGGTLGYAFSTLVEYLGIANLSPRNFTLVGMAGVMAGILHAPLTAIFLIAEITGGYELFIPLMITSSIAFATVKYTVPHSIYSLQLARRGELITHDKDTAVLTLMKLKDEVETNFMTIEPYHTLGDLVKIVAQSDRNLFPVIDTEGNFIGIVQLNDIREIMFKRELYATTMVHDLMMDAPELVQQDEGMESVMEKFERSGAWNLPVLDGSRYVGFVSKSRLFSAYRQLLRDFYQEPD